MEVFFVKVPVIHFINRNGNCINRMRFFFALHNVRGKAGHPIQYGALLRGGVGYKKINSRVT